MKDNTRSLEGSLTVNQDVVEEKLNTLKSLLRVAQNEIIENKVELKGQLRIQEDCDFMMKMKHGKTQRINRNLFK